MSERKQRRALSRTGELNRAFARHKKRKETRTFVLATRHGARHGARRSRCERGNVLIQVSHTPRSGSDRLIPAYVEACGCGAGFQDTSRRCASLRYEPMVGVAKTHMENQATIFTIDAAVPATLFQRVCKRGSCQLHYTGDEDGVGCTC